MEQNKKKPVKIYIYTNINIRLLKCAAKEIQFTAEKNQFSAKQIQFSAEKHSIWYQKNLIP